MTDVTNSQPASALDAETQISQIEKQAEQLQAFIASLGHTRELALAKTKLEEAVMWAVKAVDVLDERGE